MPSTVMRPASRNRIRIAISFPSTGSDRARPQGAPARRVYRSAPRVVRARSGPSPAGEASAELRELGGNDHAAVALRRVVLVEALVVGLGRVVRAAALDAGDDGRIEYALGLQGGDHVAGGGLLLRILGEDRRAVLGP